MPRTLKKTRIKWFPPKVQLRALDAASGSYPSKVRQASDNRSGNYNVRFNDQDTIVFSDSSVVMPVGLEQ
jgi:hypothetical protein